MNPELCEHLNPKKSNIHPGLLKCKDCGIEFFDDDRLEYSPPLMIPKGFWKQVVIFASITMTIAAAAFIIRALILYS